MSHASQPDRNLELHPGINFSRMPVGGDVGGLVFVIGAAIVVILGLPSLGIFLGAALLLGLGLAAGVFAWHRRRLNGGRKGPKIGE